MNDIWDKEKCVCVCVYSSVCDCMSGFSYKAQLTLYTQGACVF